MRYFIVTYIKKPDNKFNESVKLDDRIRPRDELQASVIIDYKERRIIKSRFKGDETFKDPKDFDTINNFYKEHYPDIIKNLEAKFQALNEIKDELMGKIDTNKIESLSKEEEKNVNT